MTRSTILSVGLAACVTACGAGAESAPYAEGQAQERRVESPAMHARIGDAPQSPSAREATADWYRTFAAADASLGFVASAIDGDGNVLVLARVTTADGGAGVVVVKYDAAGSVAWERRFAGADPGTLAVGERGEISVGATSSSGFVTLRFDAAGEQRWARRLDDGGALRGLAADAAGGVVVVGIGIEAASTKSVAHVVAYDADGAIRWEAVDDGPLHQGATARHVAVDHDGNAYVAGESSDGSHDQSTLTKYGVLGAKLWSTRAAEDPTLVPQSTAEALALDAQGNAYVASARASRTSRDAEPTVQLRTTAYDAAGATRWTATSGGAKRNIATAIAVDAEGRVTVTGFAGPKQADSFLTVQYDALGTARWTDRYAWETPGPHRANALALGARGSVVVTGSTLGADGAASFGTIAYGADGAQLWHKSFRDPDGSYSTAGSVAVDARGCVYVAGAALASPHARLGLLRYADAIR